MKLALIDIDGVIADGSARFAKAEEAKMAYLAGKEMPGDDDFFGTRVGEHVYQDSDVKAATNAYWRTAFTPELIGLDTLIDGVEHALNTIIHARYEVCFLTSRPESLRKATEVWFNGQHIEIDIAPLAYPLFNWLVMKPASQQYVKTVVWKSGIIEVLGRLFDTSELLVVDDEQTHLDAIGALSLPYELKVAASLQEAVALLDGEQ